MSTEKFKQAKNTCLINNDDQFCSVMSMMIATDLDYDDCFTALELAGRVKGQGAYTEQTLQALDILNIQHEHISGIDINQHQPNGSRYTMHSIGKLFPEGRYLVRVSGHIAAMIDGVVHDWTQKRKHKVTDVIKIEV